MGLYSGGLIRGSLRYTAETHTCEDNVFVILVSYLRQDDIEITCKLLREEIDESQSVQLVNETDIQYLENEVR